MLSETQSINNFMRNCDELISSNCILATKKISNLLKGLSSSKLFMELFEYLTADFDYESSKQKALQTKSFQGGGFIVPTDRQELLALTFALLYEIDNQSINFLNFITDYFYGGGYEESCKNFCKMLIEPFKTEVLITIKQMQNTDIPNENVVTVKSCEPVLSKNDLKEINDMLLKSKGIIFQYKMDSKVKNDLLVLYEDFSLAICGSDRYRIKVAFLGYKYSTLYHRRLDVFVGKIEKLLQKNGILEE